VAQGPSPEPQIQGILADQAHTARALLDAAEVTGDTAYLGRAIELAAFILARFAHRDDSGRVAGFFDVWDQPQNMGRLRDRQKSMQDNAVCAELLIRLHHLTRDEAYAEAARGTLEAFAGAYTPMGHFAAGYARAVDRLLNPPAVVNIVAGGSAEAGKPRLRGLDGLASSLHAAALSLDAPSRIVQVLLPGRDDGRLAALYLPPDPAPAAYVCVGTVCSAPVTSPEALVETVSDMRAMMSGEAAHGR
jgi:uncharacterized protein YyaL (SSP411 family)